MQWLKTGRQIGQAVKNAQRLRQIIAVFARHGFVDVVERLRLGRFLSARMAAFAEAQSEKSMPERLRNAFEDLGPTFVKLGQILSMRTDIVPPDFIEELVKLQDQVAPLPYEVVKQVVEAELGRSLAECYAQFSEQPLASASIGQVHTATLHSGEKVVVKVQRPEIDRIVQTDVSLLAFLAGLAEKYIPEMRVMNPTVFVSEFFTTLSYELDFVIEASNMSKMAENLVAFPDIVIPKVYKDLSARKVLTLERFEGLRVNDLAGLKAAGVDQKKITEVGARAFFKSVMIDGLFHGDLHGGNLFVLPGDRLGIIDFGIVGRLSQRSRDQLANMVMALLSEDYEALCYQYAELGAAASSIDFDAFQRDVRNTLAPHLGLSLKELNVGRVLMEATRVAVRYNVRVPGDWMVVFKAILTMEGMGRTLDPDFDMISLGQDLVKELVKNQYSVPRLTKDLLWIAKDVSELLRMLPRQIRWMFRKFNADDFAFEIKSPDLREVSYEIEAHGRRTAHATVAAGAIIAGALALPFGGGDHWHGYPVISLGCFAVGVVLVARILFRKYR